MNAKDYAKKAVKFAINNQTTLAIDYYRKALQIDPNPKLYLYQGLGNQLLKNNQLKEAENVFQELLDKYPERPQGYLGLAFVASSSNDRTTLAIDYYRKALELDPNPKPNLYQSLGNQLFKNNRLKEAEKVFQELSDKYPEQPNGYLGLARVASSSQKWEIAIRKLDLAISLFPDNLNCILQKINTLQGFALFDEAFQTLERGKSAFPNEVQLDLAEARLHQQLYNHQVAQDILDRAILKDPENLVIQLELANNYWLLGNILESENFLENIKPKLEFDNLSLIIKFTTLYVNLLLQKNEIDRLQSFFNLLGEHKILDFNHSIVMNYYRFLMNQNKYREAEHFIKDLIKLKREDSKIYQTQLVLLLELEKIKNIQALNKVDLTTIMKNQGGYYLEVLIDILKKCIERNSQFILEKEGLREIIEKIAKLTIKYPQTFVNTHISPLESYQIASYIIKHIEKKKPLSLIRLGDAEGMFLEYDKIWPPFQEQARKRIQNIYWGRDTIDRDEWEKLNNDYLLSLKNADILGIPELHRFCRNLRPGFANFCYNGEVKGLVTIIDSLLGSKLDRQPHITESSQILTSCHIHFNLEDWGLYELIFDRIKDCSIISCHEGLIDTIKEKYGVAVNKLYKIPSEYKYSQLFDYQDINKPHYPDYFHTLCSEIEVNYPGEVFLVGAGILGKIYCNLIKERGGIALDVGSILDYWLNYNTRAFVGLINPIKSNALFAKLLEKDSIDNNNQDLFMTAKDYVDIAVTLDKEGETETAINYYKKAIEIDPKQPCKIYCGLGNALVKGGLLVEGIEVLQKTIQRFSKHPFVYIYLGDALIQQNSLEEAREQYNKAVEIKPSLKLSLQKRLVKNIIRLSRNYVDRAVALDEEGETGTAIDYYKKAIQLNPKQPLRIYCGLGDALVRQGLLIEGICVFQKAIKRFPENASAYISLGNALIKQNSLEEGIKQYDRAIEINPDLQPRLQRSLDSLTLHYPHSPIKIIEKLNLSKPQGIIHVGASWGQEISSYKNSGSKNCVYIEPIPHIFEKLKENIGNIPNHYPVRAVCSDIDDREIIFYITNNEGVFSSMLPLGKHKEIHPQIKYVDSFKTHTKTLDSIIEGDFNNCHFDLLVIDTQGAELKVLMGSRRLLQTQIMYVYSKVSEEVLYEGGCTLEEQTAFLKLYGFKLKNMVFNNRGYGNALYIKDIPKLYS